MIFRSLSDDWPQDLTPSWERRNATFQASFETTMGELAYELGAINAQGSHVQLALHESYFRLDGSGLKANAPAPLHPGVLLSFALKTEGEMTSHLIPCDSYTEWQDNLRAITKTLNALRGVERWGTSRHKQYKGFEPTLVKAPSVPKPSDQDPSQLFGSRDEALMFLAFVIKSAQWKLGHALDAAALTEAIRQARQCARSPAQLALVEAAIMVINQ